MNGLVAKTGVPPYAALVGPAMVDVCGVTYKRLVDMAPNMDPDGVFIKKARSLRFGHEEFAQKFLTVHGLASVQQVGAETAEKYNLNKAAIIAFCDNPPSSPRNNNGQPVWNVGTDGLAYAALPDSRVLRMSVANKGTNWGFNVSVSDVPAVLQADPSDRLGRLAIPQVPFQRVAAQIDIGEAVQNAMGVLGYPPAPAEPAPEVSERRYG